MMDPKVLKNSKKSNLKKSKVVQKYYVSCACAGTRHYVIERLLLISGLWIRMKLKSFKIPF